MDARWQPKVWDKAYRKGMVESYFLRLNSPVDEWTVWIKYTYLRLHGQHDGKGECWLVFFDPTVSGSNRIRAWKETFAALQPAVNGGRIQLGTNVLVPGSAMGNLGGEVSWELEFRGTDAPSALLAAPFYSPAMPTTKLTTPIPTGIASGSLEIGGRQLQLTDVPLSLGHNWGHRHTPSYVWGQVSGRTGHGELFFEGAGIPAPLSNGPGKPKLTVGRGRFDGKEIDFNLPHSLLANYSLVEPGRWSFEMSNLRWRLSGAIHWDKSLVCGLRYEQPNGEAVSCLNSMCAEATLKLSRKRLTGGADVVAELHVENRAALEFVTADDGHGVEMLA
jgi:hypothetical protein